jgi:hypothetical protein
MKFLSIIRLCLATILILAAVFLVSMSRDHASITRTFPLPLIANRISLSGDYRGVMNIQKDTAIDIKEVIRFRKSLFDSLILHNLWTIEFRGRDTSDPRAKSIIAADAFRWKYGMYLPQLFQANWKVLDTSGPDYSFSKRRHLAIHVPMFSRSKTFYIPFLTTDIHDLLRDPDSRAELNDSTGFLTPFFFTYVLSASSSVSLYAEAGSVISVYPVVKAQDMLDTGDTEIFRFGVAEINQLVEDEKMSTVVNVRLLNDLLNNAIGHAIADWSVVKVIGWALTALLALFADKVKEKVFKPLIDKLWGRGKQPDMPKSSFEDD